MFFFFFFFFPKKHCCVKIFYRVQVMPFRVQYPRWSADDSPCHSPLLPVQQHSGYQNHTCSFSALDSLSGNGPLRVKPWLLLPLPAICRSKASACWWGVSPTTTLLDQDRNLHEEESRSNFCASEYTQSRHNLVRASWCKDGCAY